MATLTSCEPTGISQFQTIRNLGFERTLTSFYNVTASPSQKSSYWYLDWRTDGCSAGIEYWKNQFERPCRRHDFNWKNLYELEYWVPNAPDSWNVDNRHEADNQFGSDMSHICNGGFECNVNAAIFKAGVMVVPISNICYDHYDFIHNRDYKINNHPNKSCK